MQQLCNNRALILIELATAVDKHVENKTIAYLNLVERNVLD